MALQRSTAIGGSNCARGWRIENSAHYGPSQAAANLNSTVRRFPPQWSVEEPACGFQLANQGTDTRTLQAYLGHRNIQHTVRYT
jgi:Phage integrase family